MLGTTWLTGRGRGALAQELTQVVSVELISIYEKVFLSFNKLVSALTSTSASASIEKSTTNGGPKILS